MPDMLGPFERSNREKTSSNGYPGTTMNAAHYSVPRVDTVSNERENGRINGWTKRERTIESKERKKEKIWGRSFIARRFLFLFPPLVLSCLFFFCFYLSSKRLSCYMYTVNNNERTGDERYITCDYPRPSRD